MEVDTDHIHFLIEYEPKVSVTQIVKCLKRETTHRLWEDHEGYLKKQFWNERTFWSDGFFACSIGEASDETIINCRTGATLTPGQLNCCPFCFIGLFDILYVLVYIIIYEAGDKNGKK
jgi:putative transposase